jgi:hypothetical protein
VSKLIALDGSVYDAVPVGADDGGCIRDDGCCCGCGMATGKDHDPGCDWEPCPRCGAQLISCNCDDRERPYFDIDEAKEVIANLTAAIEEAGR